MVEQIGTEKTKALAQYAGTRGLTESQAKEIIRTIWPTAPEVEVYKAMMICCQYHLNPLMKHLFLIPFKNKKTGEIDWATVLGIKAKRLIGQEVCDFSYLDDTPRVMTEKEQKRILGEIDGTKIWTITKLKDTKGRTAQGYGNWPKDDVPYGSEKGNSKVNMSMIHSESNALERLFPGRMPTEGVVDENYLPDAGTPLISPGSEKTGEATATKPDKPPTETVVAAAETVSEQKGSKPSESVAPPPATGIDMDWLRESLPQAKWTEDTAKSWLARFKVDTKGKLEEVLARLTREQKEIFVKEIQDRLSMV